MSVDKFGRTNVGTLQRVVSGGVTLSQVNNTFLSRDGGNSATANINMDSHKLINVSDPTSDQDTATKHYVDNRTLLPNKKLLAPYATDSNTYIWKDFQALPPVISESEFDELPAGLYACYTSYIPPTRLGILPTNTKGYLIALTYQQPADRNKYYKWINSTNGEQWEAYFKQGVWNKWIKSSKVSKSGDTMKGNLSLSVGSDLLRTLGCSDLSGSKGFAVLLGSETNQIQCHLDQPISFLTTDGFRIMKGATSLAKFGNSFDNRIDIYQDVLMNNCYIANLHDPSSPQDAATKNYVDVSSYITAYPTMTANTTTVDGLTYTTSASSAIYQPWHSFKNIVVSDGWVAATNENQWIQMQYPSTLSMAGFYIVAGRNITSWKIQASCDGTIFTDIVPTNTTVFNAGVLKKFTFAASTPYMYWKFFIISSVGSVNVGMLQWIPALTDRFLKKCNVGYVPRLTSNTNYRGFTPSASSEISSNFIAANVFKGDYGIEWCTAGISSNFWIKIACPTAVRTWKFGFRGRDSNSERIYNWRIEGSTDNKNWVVLYSAPNPTYLGNKYQEFSVDSIVKFRYYRLFCVNSEVTNPGLSSMQLFVYDD